MNHKLAVTILAGILPFIALGDATNQPAQSLRLKVTCRSGAVVILDNAALMERGTKKDGAIPPSTGTTADSVRLEMPDAGTVTILWENIEKIVVREQESSENAYPIEIKLKNVAEAKTGKTYGPDCTVVGRSDVGEFTIQLKDVTEIVTLPALVGK